MPKISQKSLAKSSKTSNSSNIKIESAILADSDSDSDDSKSSTRRSKANDPKSAKTTKTTTKSIKTTSGSKSAAIKTTNKTTKAASGSKTTEIDSKSTKAAKTKATKAPVVNSKRKSTKTKKATLITHYKDSKKRASDESSAEDNDLSDADIDRSTDDDENESPKKDNKILEIKTSQTGAIKQVIERISNVISDCCIVFLPYDDGKNSNESDKDDGTKTKKNTGGIRILRLTEDKSILIKLNLDAPNFDSFRCDEPKITIGVDMSNFYAALKTINDNDPIILYMNRDNRNSLYIRSLNQSNESSEETDIEIFLMEITNPDLPLPQTDFQSKIIMKSEKFHTACKQLHNSATFVEITSIDDQISFKGQSEGAKISKSYRDINQNKPRNKKDKKNIIQGVYELRNLMGFSKCNKLCDIIEIYLKNDFPLVLVISIANLGKMYVFLTPIEDPPQ